MVSSSGLAKGIFLWLQNMYLGLLPVEDLTGWGWVKVRDVMHGCQGKFIDPDTVPPSCAVLTPPSPLNPDISEWQEAKFELASKTLPLTKHFKLHWHRDQILLILAHIFIYTHIYIYVCMYLYIKQFVHLVICQYDYLYTAEQLKHIIAVLYNAQ